MRDRAAITELSITIILTSITIDPIDEEVHGSCFGHLSIFAVEPENLLAAPVQGFTLDLYCRSIVPGNFTMLFHFE